MNEQTKKILLIAGFIITALIMAGLIFFIFFYPLFAPPAQPTPTPTPVTNINFLPPTPTPGLTPTPLITPTPVTGLTPTPAETADPIVTGVANGGITSYQTLETNQSKNATMASNGQDLIYLDTETGYFFQVDEDGNKQFFSDKPFLNVDKVTWAPDTNKAVLEYPDGSNIIYDFQRDKSLTLPNHWEDFHFSNDSEQLVFKDMKLDKENRFLAISDTNGASYQQIELIGDSANFAYPTWSPNEAYVGFFSQSIDANRAEVYPIGLNGENYTKLRVEGRDFRFIWSPSGNKMVYSVFNSRSDYNPLLWVVNTNTNNLATGRNNLGVQTWADKCVFASEDIIYCAVPEDLETGTGFSPDLADDIPDLIYKINIVTARKQLAAQPLFPTTIEQLFISSDSSYVYWLDKNTGQINKMNLEL